jgi:hypothetical protein
VNVSAPCGVALFGGNTTYQKARNEIGTSLAYRARFVPSAAATSAPTTTSATSRNMVADREYNVVSIVQSAMGQNSMVNVDKATPNEFACTLLSGGGSANNLFRVNMLTVQRKQEEDGGDMASSASSNIRTFACSEVVQELIRPVAVASDASSAGSSTAAPPPPPPTSILKQIETISLYEYDPTSDPSMIECVQRTASYVVPSQTDPLQAQLYRMTQGMPVDVRQYKVTYRRDDAGAK